MDSSNEMDEASTKPIFKDKFHKYILITSSIMDYYSYETRLFKADSINDDGELLEQKFVDISQINYYDGELVVRYKTDNSNEIKMFHDITFYQLKKILRNENYEYLSVPKLEEIASKLYEFCSILE